MAGVSITPQPFFTPGKTHHPLYRRLDGPPRQVWTSAVNLASTRIRWWARPAQQECYVCWIMSPSLHFIYHNAYPCNGSILVDLKQNVLNVCNQQARFCWLVIRIKQTTTYTVSGNMQQTLTHVQRVLVQLGYHQGMQCNTIGSIKQGNSAYMNMVGVLN
jgi:hypothetical protein